ncbi:MAG: hypothetical protein ACLRM0_08275 [[Clostridium] leptum]
MSFIARTFPYFFRKGFLPFLKKQKYHTQPPAMATTIMPPMTHQTTGLPVLLSCSASEDVLLTLLPEASNSSRPRASEELSLLEESSEGASLLDGFSLVDASEEEGIAEFGAWLEEGACSDGVWLERVCVCWVAAAGCGL